MHYFHNGGIVCFMNFTGDMTGAEKDMLPVVAEPLLAYGGGYGNPQDKLMDDAIFGDDKLVSSALSFVRGITKTCEVHLFPITSEIIKTYLAPLYASLKEPEGSLRFDQHKGLFYFGAQIAMTTVGIVALDTPWEERDPDAISQFGELVIVPDNLQAMVESSDPKKLMIVSDIASTWAHAADHEFKNTTFMNSVRYGYYAGDQLARFAIKYT